MSHLRIELADLQRIPMFQKLSEQDLRQVARFLVPRRYPAGKLIALDGDPCNEVGVIISGLMRVRQLSLDGREYVLAYLEPGKWYNLVPALEGGAIVGTLDALSDVRACVLRCEDLAHLLQRVPDLAVGIARYLARENRRLSQMAQSLALEPVRARLAAFLLNHAEHEPGRQRWTQAMIAANIGTVRDVVGRVLRAFVQEGLLRREQGRLVIVDREKLAREAEGR